MWRDYRRERAHQKLLHRFDLLLTHSEHVRAEYVRHGLPNARVRCVPFFVSGNLGPATQTRRAERTQEAPIRLLFLGRFDTLKGGQLLLHALPIVRRRLQRPLEAVIAGDGPARSAWENLAVPIVTEAGGSIRIRFPGWLTGEAKTAALADTDLLVIPSVWPEPFGMTGIEAGHHGVPAVAFDVGGVRAWLRPGINGNLASGSPPTVQGLADATIEAVGDAGKHSRLCEGARTVAAEFSRSRHLAALEEQFIEARAIRARRQS
jgi:glycosyltransferase involved in cell wall biosynthesis